MACYISLWFFDTMGLIVNNRFVRIKLVYLVCSVCNNWYLSDLLSYLRPCFMPTFIWTIACSIPGSRTIFHSKIDLTNAIPTLRKYENRWTNVFIAGKDNIHPADLKKFMLDQNQLKFIGLMLTDACKDEIFQLPGSNLIVSGSANEAQVLESLQRYIGRQHYIKKSLSHLFGLTQGYSTPRVDIIKVNFGFYVLQYFGVEGHPSLLKSLSKQDHITVQIKGLCFCNFCRER